MPIFYFDISDGFIAEMHVECETPNDAVSLALAAMSAHVSTRATPPSDISITLVDAERSQVAVIAVTFSMIQNKSSAH